ncbi:MAG TPA: aldo/keto reductase [Gaiellaceae bacterium]|jgi:aryl-alcohol dehydrogenase-like predicted oxidoreductase
MENMVGTAKRKLGHSGIKVSAMGLGCWAIGGAWTWDGTPVGWGETDDEESIRAIRAAIDLGVTFFDTADVYGCGRSERVLGKAIAGRGDEIVVATKFGNVFDEETRNWTGEDVSPAHIREACRASLKRLGLDQIDLYQLHIWSLPQGKAEVVAETLEELVAEGLIRAYGWSTDDLSCARWFAPKPGCTSIQNDLNVFKDATEILAICDEHDLASINRAPLAMGILSGKFGPDSKLPEDDVRGQLGPEWVQFFKDGRPQAELLEKVDALREVLTSGGRTLVQGALAWIWGRSERTIPIPGFKSVKQAEENARALELGPLTPAQMNEVAEILRAG